MNPPTAPVEDRFKTAGDCPDFADGHHRQMVAEPNGTVPFSQVVLKHPPSLPIVTAPAAEARLPRWLKKQLPVGDAGQFTARLVEELGLNTVCESAKCPNRGECWSQRTATFMILGDTCTRPCGFCSVAKGKTAALELDEPERVAEAARRLGLAHVVITSVTRDDLPDGGAEHFYRSVLAVRTATSAKVEVLTPDFIGKLGALERVVQAARRGVQPQHGDRAAAVPPGAGPQERLSLDARTVAARETTRPIDQDQERADARPGRNPRRAVRDARRSRSTPAAIS